MKLEKITDEKKLELGKEIRMIGEKYGLKIEICASKKDFSKIGIYPAKCIDDGLIGRILGKELLIPDDLSQRQECGCVKSIGCRQIIAQRHIIKLDGYGLSSRCGRRGRNEQKMGIHLYHIFNYCIYIKRFYL